MEIQILSVEGIVRKITGFEEFVEKTENWVEARAGGIRRVSADHCSGPFRVDHRVKNGSHYVSYGELTRVKTPTKTPSSPLQLYVRKEKSIDTVSEAEDKTVSRADSAETGDGDIRLFYFDVVDVHHYVRAKYNEEQLIIEFVDGERITFDDTAWIESAYHPGETDRTDGGDANVS